MILHMPVQIILGSMCPYLCTAREFSGEVGVRDGFGDLGATVCKLLGCTPELQGKSFADVILR